MSRRVPWIAGLMLLLITGCPKPKEELEPFTPQPPPPQPVAPPAAPDYNRPLGPGEMALRKLDPRDYPDFRPSFGIRAGLDEALRHSLDYLAKKSSQKYFPYLDVSHARAVASLRRFQELLRTARTAEEFDATIKRDFEVYQSVGYDGAGGVLFTGYYTPIFEGRKQPDSRFRYPLYRLPPDLMKDAEGNTLGRKNPDGSTVPGYPTRREIEQSRALQGTEIAWLSDPFEAYVVSVQGSAKLRLADGSFYEIGYAGNNGHEYTPIAEAMIREGVIRKEDLSLQTLLRYFRENPGQVANYTWRNDRYVFFKETRGGPYGSIGAPVTASRTIATDKSVFPRACLAFAVTQLPVLNNGQVMQADAATFVLDQDTGGAIRAAGRCDVYMGVGPAAEAVAGRTWSVGKLYYVFVRE